jgi:hypothetical protein
MGAYSTFRMMATFGAGAAAGSDITITGIALGDEIIAALEIQPPTAGSGNTIKTDLYADTTYPITITAANKVQVTTGGTNTTGNQVLVFWVKKN